MCHWREMPALTARTFDLAGVTEGIIGGVLGMWAGAAFGAALEGDSCRCDSPGLKGALFGAPVGAAIGAVLGVFLAGN